MGSVVGVAGASRAGGETGEAAIGASGGEGTEEWCSGEVLVAVAVVAIIISVLGLARATGELLLLPPLLLLSLLLLLLLGGREGPSGPSELGTGDGAVVAMTRKR